MKNTRQCKSHPCVISFPNFRVANAMFSLPIDLLSQVNFCFPVMYGMYVTLSDLTTHIITGVANQANPVRQILTLYRPTVLRT